MSRALKKAADSLSIWNTNKSHIGTSPQLVTESIEFIDMRVIVGDLGLKEAGVGMFNEKTLVLMVY